MTTDSRQRTSATHESPSSERHIDGRTLNHASTNRAMSAKHPASRLLPGTRGTERVYQDARLMGGRVEVRPVHHTVLEVTRPARRGGHRQQAIRARLTVDVQSPRGPIMLATRGRPTVLAGGRPHLSTTRASRFPSRPRDTVAGIVGVISRRCKGSSEGKGKGKLTSRKSH